MQLEYLAGQVLVDTELAPRPENYDKMFVVNDGKIVWTYSTGKGNEYDDAWMLSNGNILYSRMQYLAEITPEKQVVWRYDCPTNTEAHCCQPIGLDKVLFIQNGLPPKLMVVNIKTGADRSGTSAAGPQSDRPKDGPSAIPSRARYGAGNLSCADARHGHKRRGGGIRQEISTEVWRYAIRSPWAAIRLKNGNTLITDENDKLTREVNPKGETVWELKPDDLPEQYRFINTQTCTRLANGNTIICSRGGSGKGPQLVEVAPDKKVVWVLQDWADLGPATAVQILDDPGIPENPGESEH